MTSDNTEMKTASRVYISLPKTCMADLAKNYELDHGLVVKDQSPYLHVGYIQAYFKKWGTITSCQIKKIPNSEKAIAFVMFSKEEEADRADWAGPHYIGGMEVTVKRFVSPKIKEVSLGEVIQIPTTA